MYQYRCACCNTVVSSTDTSCPECGSHSIRSPFGFWFFCIVTCLVMAVGIIGGKIYLQQNDEEPQKVISDLFHVTEKTKPSE
ncbi:hypothetical protein [Acinetobacter sp. MD2(2019)]|uniref:hypothetical protein n=1 Tax=Acinetobacter sp. MD2(2019) TaxID=2605273 RepID=UPI002D1E7F8A|nr:hypothetical protein [Acinetobacter sp. MD2(2019)]MEB3754880.1 hypothetical protein [Acinetobacter sp. MD2(2019)]